jgi:RNA 2',3'-cyclic 3'-phosphodiesterase
MTRLFVAVWPPEDVIEVLERLPRYPLAGARWTTHPQWHVTLRYLGAADVGVTTEAFESLEADKCTAVLGPRARPINPSALVVPVAGLDNLATAVERAMAGIGRPAPYPYRGHLTLARAGNGALPRLDVEVVAHWPVDEVALVESHLHPSGATYETLHVRSLA